MSQTNESGLGDLDRMEARAKGLSAENKRLRKLLNESPDHLPPRMSVRTWLAGQAMKGILSNPVFHKALAESVSPEEVESLITGVAVRHADFMIAKLEE